MSVDSDKIKRAISSFNNQITRISKIANTFSVGNKVRVNLESEIVKLVEDRDTLQGTLSPTIDAILKAQVKIEKVGISENVNYILKKVKESDKKTVLMEQILEQQNKHHKEVLAEVRKGRMSKRWAFFISLLAGITGLVIGNFVFP